MKSSITGSWYWGKCACLDMLQNTHKLLLPMYRLGRCGGRKTSPRALNQWCYYFLCWTWLCVTFTVVCVASMVMLFFSESIVTLLQSINLYVNTYRQMYVYMHISIYIVYACLWVDNYIYRYRRTGSETLCIWVYVHIYYSKEFKEHLIFLHPFFYLVSALG